MAREPVRNGYVGQRQRVEHNRQEAAEVEDKKYADAKGNRS